MEQQESDKLPLSFGPAADDTNKLPKARRDVEITEQVYFGKGCYVLKDPAALRYYRLRPPEYTIYQMLDGERTMEEVLGVLAERFPAEQYDRQAVMSFMIMLRGANLLHVPGPASTEYLLKRKEMLQRGFFKRLRTEFLFYRIPLLDPDRLLNFLYRYLSGLIYSRTAGIVAVLVLVGAVALLVGDIDKLGRRQPLLSWINIMFYLVPSLALVKVIHEFGHGLTSKHFGSEVHEMGILFLVFMPCAYCDVSDAWMISEKRKRMWITGAGVGVEIMLAALATYVWALTEARTVPNQLALNIMAICSINSLLFNGNPLLRYDGYYFLMDLVEMPNLKQKGTGYLWYLMQRYVLGVDNAPEPIDVRGREPMVLGYAICSAIYRWFIMYAIVMMVWKFLDPYGWGVIGAIMALGCVSNAFLMPVVKFVRFLFTQWHRLHIRPASAVVLVLLAGGIGYGVLALPVEQTVEAQCVLRPANLHPLYAAQGGFIEAERNKSFIEDGRHVNAGDVLLVLSDPQLERQVDDLKLQLQQLGTQLTQAKKLGAASQVAQIEARIKELKARLEWAQQKFDKLTIKAPISGVVQLRTDRPLRNLAGSYLPLQAELFAVYQPHTFEAVAAINHRQNGLIKPGQQVQIRLWALHDETLESEVRVKPPKPVLKMSSAAFSTVFKGEVATMPAASAEEALEPAENTYELVLSLAEDGRLRDGLVGRAKVIVEEKTLGEAFYMWLIRTLRLNIRL